MLRSENRGRGCATPYSGACSVPEEWRGKPLGCRRSGRKVAGRSSCLGLQVESEDLTGSERGRSVLDELADVLANGPAVTEQLVAQSLRQGNDDAAARYRIFRGVRTEAGHQFQDFRAGCLDEPGRALR